MRNSLIQSGSKRGLFGAEEYTKEDLDYFIENFEDFEDNSINKGYGFEMKTLSLLSSNEDYTALMYNGEEITFPSELINDLIVSGDNTYSAEKIEARLLEIINTIGVGSGSGTAVVTQKTFLKVSANDILNINAAENLDLQKAIIQPYKFVAGAQDIVEIIKDFDNTEKESFYYNPEMIEFDGAMKIKDKYPLVTTLNSDGLYETEIINKKEFLSIHKIEVM